MSKVKENDTVRVHYTGKLTTGEVFDSSLEREPLEVALGQGSLIPGFEKGLLDMAVSEKKTIQIPMEEAYGEVQKELFQEIGKEQLPAEITPEIGMGLVARGEDGSERQLRIADVKADSIVVDAN
ncbi:FKBP-type peptidyl-prolyl cis-trans isomerase, partial [Robiginitalea sp.]